MIEDEVIKHHINERIPNNKMVNDFALQFCTENDFELDVVNATGNHFQFV